MQHVVARPAPALSKQLAYDIVKAGAPGDGDWDFVYAGMRFDLAPGSPPEVAAAALAALQGLPPHRFAEALAPLPANAKDDGSSGRRGVDGGGSSSSMRGGIASAAAAPQPLVRQPPQSPSFTTAPSAGGAASGASANLAALDAAIQGSGPSAAAANASARGNGVPASGPSVTANGNGDAAGGPGQHQLVNREDSYSTGAGIRFESLGIAAVPAGVEPSMSGDSRCTA